MYGEGAVTDQTCQKWFAKFCAGDFSLDDALWSRRPADLHSNQIKTSLVIENNQCVIPRRREPTSLKYPNNKVVGENEKCVFYFTEKTQWTFWPTQ